MEIVFGLVALFAGWKMFRWTIRQAYKQGFADGEAAALKPMMWCAVVRSKDAPRTGRTIMGRFDN